MYIAGRNWNFRVLSDFRKDHGEFFRSCFKQTVQLAMGLGLVSLGHVSLDFPLNTVSALEADVSQDLDGFRSAGGGLHRAKKLHHDGS